VRTGFLPGRIEERHADYRAHAKLLHAWLFSFLVNYQLSHLCYYAWRFMMNLTQNMPIRLFYHTAEILLAHELSMRPRETFSIVPEY
jgi:hypothetical protein